MLRGRVGLCGVAIAALAVAGCSASHNPHPAAGKTEPSARADCPVFDKHRVSAESMTHTAAQAQREAPLVRDAEVIEVFPVRIVDPVARKIGLSAPDAERNMWVIRAMWHFKLPPGATGAIGEPTPGAVVTANYLVDDGTLRLAGNLDCRSTLRG